MKNIKIIIRTRGSILALIYADRAKNYQLNSSIDCEIDEILIQTSKKDRKNHWAYYQLIRDVIQNNHIGSEKLTNNIRH